MKKVLLLCLILSISKFSYGLNNYEISLLPETIHLTDRKFYIDAVIDNRIDKKHLGIIQIGIFKTKYAVQLENGLSNSLQDFFDYAIPRSNGQIPIILKIKKFNVSEGLNVAGDKEYANLSLEFYNGNKLLYSSSHYLDISGKYETRLNEEVIRGAFRKSLIDFNNSGWYAIYNDKTVLTNDSEGAQGFSVTTTPNAPFSTSNMENMDLTSVHENRNVFAIGYQIGGFSAIGFDYEIRASDLLGIHFGGGLYGYTYGVMLHTNPHKESSYFNVSYKDGGFGLLKTAGIEYGGKWILNKQSGFGILIQFGIVKLIKIHDILAESLFKDGKRTEYITSVGIGLCW